MAFSVLAILLLSSAGTSVSDPINDKPFMPTRISFEHFDFLISSNMINQSYYVPETDNAYGEDTRKQMIEYDKDSGLWYLKVITDTAFLDENVIADSKEMLLKIVPENNSDRFKVSYLLMENIYQQFYERKDNYEIFQKNGVHWEGTNGYQRLKYQSLIIIAFQPSTIKI